VATHIRRMKNAYVGMPIVEVVAPDGTKSFWAAAVGHGVAVDVPKPEISPNTKPLDVRAVRFPSRAGDALWRPPART
jgi:hypothetical protein